MRWRNVLVVAAVALPLLVVLALGFGLDPRAVPSVLPGRAAPPCTLTGLDGEATTLAQFRGRPIVLNFWASWCVPCVAEHQTLQQAARRYGEQVQFLGVVYQDEPDSARRYLARHGSSFLQTLDPSSRCAIEYGVAGVPETFYIDAGGIVVDKSVGPVTPQGLTTTLTAMLARGNP